MLNMEQVGKTIARLRKQHNMTQLELADKMGISFQAVSNWERGNSMPDVSKLPELAALFDVTIDQLLGEKSELMEHAVQGDIKEYFETNPVTAAELRDIAPMLKPDQIDALAESEKITDFHDMEDLLPFIGTDVADKLAQKMISKGESIADVAPFMSRKMIGELAESLYQTGGLNVLEDILPHLPQKSLIKIAEEEYASRGLRHFDIIAPFLNRTYLNNLAQKAIQKDGIKAISNIAPFLDKRMLAEYVKETYL